MAMGEVNVLNCYFNYGQENNYGTKIDTLSSYLNINGNNYNSNNYIGGFGDKTGENYQYPWTVGKIEVTDPMTGELETINVTWDFDTVWAIESGINGGLPYLIAIPPQGEGTQGSTVQLTIEYSGSAKFLIVVEYGDSACAFTYSGTFTFNVVGAECKVAIIGYNGESTLTLNDALQTISNNTYTISLEDTNNIVLTLG